MPVNIRVVICLFLIIISKFVPIKMLAVDLSRRISPFAGFTASGISLSREPLRHKIRQLVNVLDVIAPHHIVNVPG